MTEEPDNLGSRRQAVRFAALCGLLLVALLAAAVIWWPQWDPTSPSRQNGAPVRARSYSFDLTFKNLAQPVVVTIHGEAGHPELGLWRFMVKPNYARNTSGLVSVFDGSAWEPLGVVSELTRRGRSSRIEVDASLHAAVLRVDNFAFRTTSRASEARSVTTLHVGAEEKSVDLSEPTAGAWEVSRVVSVDLAEESPRLAEGVVAQDVITQYQSGTGRRDMPVGILPIRPDRMSHFSVQAHIGDTWHEASLRPSPDNQAIQVLAPLDDPDIGERPVTITVTDKATGTSLSSQAKTQSLARFPRQAIASEASPYRPYFPDAVTLNDGSILLAYRAATSHAGSNGAIKIIRSRDHGTTWSTPRTVLDSPFDDRDPKLAQLDEGTILLTTFRTDWSVTPSLNKGTFITQSVDGGFTFGEEVAVETHRAGAWQHAPVVELENGDLLQPLYGGGARLARSVDGGRSFAADDEITVLADTAQYKYREPNIVRLPDGQLVMTIRTTDVAWGQITESVLVRSHDGGQTWSQPEEMDYPTSSHHMLVTSSGSVLLTWGNAWRDLRPTYGTLIAKPHRSWRSIASVGVLHTARADQANPSAVELPDGGFLVFGYDVRTRKIVQVHVSSLR